MARRLLYALFVVVTVAIGTFALWSALSRGNEQQIARIAEAESYAARSQLIRSTEALISALHNIRTYWTANGRLEPARWPGAEGIEMTSLAGVTLLLWDDPVSGTRFLRTPESRGFTYRPTDEEWERFGSLTGRARSLEQNAIVGPYEAADGSAWFEVYLVAKDEGVSGHLVALVDARQALERMLLDVSPGYAIRVVAKDMVLYERGRPATGAPADWTRSGLIRSSLGSLWTVEHRPTATLVATIDSPAVDLVLLLGLFISVLLGTLVYENGRARSRAAAAEAAELKLAELNRNLEENIADRTRQLRDRTLDLQTLADSVAHDLRNPLNSLSVNAQLLEERARHELSPESMRVLERFTPSVNQMANILDRLLGLSEVAHATFGREPIDMQELVGEIAEDLSGAEPPPPVRFLIDEQLPEAFADPTLVHMLLTNLLANAIKYTRSRESRIVTVGSEVHERGTVYYVADNGIGFDQDHADSIFGAFNRLDKASSSEGIGLGLTIAHRVVERHDGRIWAEGRAGEGATFYFELGTEAAPGSD
jgi:signal transduction histidine kinase